MSEKLEDLEVATSPYQFEVRFQMDWEMTLHYMRTGVKTSIRAIYDTERLSGWSLKLVHNSEAYREILRHASLLTLIEHSKEIEKSSSNREFEANIQE